MKHVNFSPLRAVVRYMAASGLVVFSIGQGVVKQTRWKRQAAKGTLATTGSAQILRRQTSNFELKRDAFDTSAEINSAQQLASAQLGAKAVTGSVNGYLTPGVYSDMLAALLRRDFASVTPSTGVTLTIAGTGPTYTVTRSAGSWLSDGYKVGMVIRLSVGTLNAANISKNLFVTAIGSATVLTVMPVNGVALVAEGPITTCTITATGKVTFAPPSGHTKIYYTIEEWMSDVPASEYYQDVMCGSAQIKLPGTGLCSITLGFDGLDQLTNTTAYFVTPTAEGATDVVSAPIGLLLVNGVSQAAVTNMEYTIDAGQALADACVGSNVRPDVFRGKLKVSGQFTAYFDSTTVRDLFLAATDIGIINVLPNGAGAAADFISTAMPRLKITSASAPEDGETGLKRTYGFTAEYNVTGGTGIATEQTTFQMQDSLAA